ncbi:hypothetical protein Pmar_PMAR023539 [Perkinsus marinus ATCC 50983]|uniref:Uncharacterized protein n=1 Tax=Perkinsus marinus (strain ATCC 50983 / TXsc) TaxID=423536 RepID=C5KCM3_PERM5|nr:hypothetical protein Pmar_PMAR023539 [Perkinsus marinus ATCC 50983]EER17622.1 hypothetical protein Pmar_PMAR023539 [Perkinsus marinus ATCC 50983]|mmetsp:Transcript_9702/g.9571  ORF Transcript_9702/g.9571 Transcript_9702/m.9571 type:complete len:127 (-) Transcript_9702:228-608(-)|eukprot:XP_002785826.1 hypothetical protein Pmar_PMAR023539 [Perkinsus marinus ATCC 50983]
MHFLINILVIAFVAADNACTDADKKTIDGKLFTGFLYHCASDALFNPKGIIPKCLKEGCGLTDGCAQCFGQYGQCGLSCALQCLKDPSDPACKTCMDDHGCTAALLKCTGLKERLLPPKGKSDKCS